MDLNRRRVVQPVSPKGVSKVVQNGLRDASVQAMMEAANRGGLSRSLPSGNRQPIYADFTLNVYRDFQSSMNAVLDVRRHFDALPSLIRAEFDNDPNRLAFALDDPSSQARMAELGFKVAPKPPVPPVAPPAPPEPPVV